MAHERDEYPSRLTSDVRECIPRQPHFSNETANFTTEEIDRGGESSSAEAAREERVSGMMSTTAIIHSFGETLSSSACVDATESECAYDNQPRFQGDTTDPSKHDPTNFRYLVHALNPGAKMSAMRIAVDFSDHINSSHGNQSINMYKQPERVAERVSLSMSLIDQDHTATWGDGGLIISAPEENIVLTSRTDAGTHNNDKNFLLGQGARHGVMSADQLLATTSPRQYNEVVALADNDGSKLETIGFFYKVTSKGEPVDPVIARQMRMHAERLGLPVVEIPQENEIGRDRVDRYESLINKGQECIAVTYNGERYLMLVFSGHSYNIVDEAETYRFASPEEMAAALQFAVGTNDMSEAEAQQIMDGYTEAHDRRMTPTAYYDSEGNCEKIMYYEGYGDDELRITLYNSGYIRRVRTKRESEEQRRAMLGDFVRHDAQSRSIPARPHVADSMVKRAKEGLDEAKADELQQWYDKCREAIEQNWRAYVQRCCRKKAVKSNPKTISRLKTL